MNNNTSYETQAIDLSLLSVLDITKEGKVVSVEKWVELWTLVFQHINKIDAFCVDMQATLDNWHASEVALNEIIEDMQLKYASLSTGFTHYGEVPPQNPHIKFWVRRMEDIETHCFITNADIDKTYNPESPNAQSGIAVAEALSGYVMAEVGKGLSTNDFTDEDKEKLGSALQADAISDKMDKFGTVELSGTRLGDVTASVKNFQLLNLTGESGLGLGVHEARLHSKEAAILSKLNTETGDSTEVAVGDGIVNLSSGKDDVILNGVATPTDDNHGTNKQYVDEAVAEAVGVANDYTDKAIKSLKTYANNTFAPAIKNTVSGGVLAVHDVSPVEHALGVSVRSKNLLPYPYPETTKTMNGITFTDNGDGTVTANGTATGGMAYFDLSYASKQNNLEIGKIYTLSGCASGGSDTTYRLRITNGGISDIGNGNTFVLQSKGSIQIQIMDGVTVENLVFKPQLELGTTATEYTPYVADLSAVGVSRLGKNLMPYPYLDTTKIQNGLTFIDNGDGSITIDGTATALTYFNLAPQPLTLPAGTYMLSGNNGEVNIGNQIFLQKTGLYINDNGVGKTFTLTEETTFRSIGLFIGVGNTMDNITFKPQLELGSTATDYEPYIVPQIATTNADGTVDGLTSLSPNITVTTDTQGVVIDMTYNADTKMYIDNKLAEISAAIVNS